MMNYIIVFLISMVPLIELRGSILYATGIGLPFLPAYITAIIGNMLPVPFIFLFARKILVWGADKPVIGRFFSFCERREGRQEASGEGRQRFVCGAFIIRGHSASGNRCLDGNSGSQSSGYGFQVQCGGCYVRCTPGRYYHGSRKCGTFWRAWRIDWLETYKEAFEICWGRIRRMTAGQTCILCRRGLI